MLFGSDWEDCPCRGANANCRRCDGRGSYQKQKETGSKQEPRVLQANPTKSGGHVTRAQGAGGGK